MLFIFTVTKLSIIQADINCKCDRELTPAIFGSIRESLSKVIQLIQELFTLVYIGENLAQTITSFKETQ